MFGVIGNTQSEKKGQIAGISHILCQRGETLEGSIRVMMAFCMFIGSSVQTSASSRSSAGWFDVQFLGFSGHFEHAGEHMVLGAISKLLP